jgi:hypothetical protein
MYLTYDEYAQMGGEELEETAFEQLEFEARSQIDWWTFGRLKNEESYPEAVKRCMFKLIELLDKQQKVLMVDAVDEDGNVKAGLMASQSNDGVSSTYNVITGNMAVRVIQSQLNNTIRMYLQDVRDSLGRKVLYRGLYPGE